MNQRVAIFIDGGNFYHSTKRLEEKGYKIDFQKIIKELAREREVNTFYYTALLDKDYNWDRYEEHNNFLEDLRKIPNFHIVLCDLRKLINKDGSFRYEIKGDDVYLAHDLLICAFDNLYDVAIIVSGDADFIPIIQTLRERFNKKVGNAYFRRTSSFKLRSACNFSIDMDKLTIKLNKEEKKASVPSEDDTSRL